MIARLESQSWRFAHAPNPLRVPQISGTGHGLAPPSCAETRCQRLVIDSYSWGPHAVGGSGAGFFVQDSSHISVTIDVLVVDHLLSMKLVILVSPTGFN